MISLPKGSSFVGFARRAPLGAVAALVILAAISVGIFADTLAPHDPLAHDPSNRLVAPSAAYPMGTDNFGRDVLSRVIHGTRVSLQVGLVSVVWVGLIGTLLGTASACVGGRIDLWGQRVTDGVMAFPALVLALVLVAGFGPSTPVVIASIVVALTPQMTRLARARCLEIKEHEYVAAARAVGASEWRIIFRHILPGSLPATLVLSAGYVGQAMVMEAALSYLGLGVPPPDPAWGRMIYEGARLYLETAPWLTIFPGLALSLLVLAFALLGDALRDALDPRGRR